MLQAVRCLKWKTSRHNLEQGCQSHFTLWAAYSSLWSRVDQTARVKLCNKLLKLLKKVLKFFLTLGKCFPLWTHCKIQTNKQSNYCHCLCITYLLWSSMNFSGRKRSKSIGKGKNLCNSSQFPKLSSGPELSLCWAYY